MKRPVKTLAELDASIIPLRETRTCDVCGGFTWWMAPKQRTHGRCPTCADLRIEPDVALEAFDRAETLLMATFPGARIDYDVTSPAKAPGVYGQRTVSVVVTLQWKVSGLRTSFISQTIPDDAGPCERCRQVIQRYGHHGRLRCRACEEKRG